MESSVHHQQDRFHSTVTNQPFNPSFDDCTPYDAWVGLPFTQAPVGHYGSFEITATEISYAPICDEKMAFDPPLGMVRLYDNKGTAWMSDKPQERAMMYNNAAVSTGRTLMGGLGLGLYAQYALPNISELVVVERNQDIIDVIGPIVEAVADKFSKNIVFINDDIEAFLRAENTELFDTIFLDTWERLSPFRLPYINTLRDLALAHTSPTGRLLLWGYAATLKMFHEIIDLLLSVPVASRSRWVGKRTFGQPNHHRVLQPIYQHLCDNPHISPNVFHQWGEQFLIQLTSKNAP